MLRLHAMFVASTPVGKVPAPQKSVEKVTPEEWGARFVQMLFNVVHGTNSCTQAWHNMTMCCN